MIDCNTCPHLFPTEALQHQLWRAAYKKAMLPHTCLKYNQRVLHYPYREPAIHPCEECIKERKINYDNM